MSARNGAPIRLWERMTERELQIKIGMQRDEIARLRQDIARAERVALVLAIALVLILIRVASQT